MSTKQTTKRTANTESEIVSKKVKIVSAQNNNVVDQNGKFHADDEVTVVDGIVKSRKLPDEVLQKFNNEPSHLLIAGNVAWNAGGANKVLKRNELFVFHRFTDKKVSKIDGN